MTRETKSAEVEHLLASLGDLPSSPAVVSAVIGMAADLNTRLSDLGNVLSADQALAAKILRLSNSAFYGRLKQIGTVDEAIRILGYCAVRSLVVACSAHRLFKQQDATRFLPILWEHSLGGAVAARLLGRQLRHSQTEEAFMAALLHDIGKLVMAQKLEDEYVKFHRSAEAEGDICKGEKARFGFSHVDVGVALLDKWNFPPELAEAVALHHVEPEAAPERPPTLTHLVWLSNRIAKVLLAGPGAPESEDWEALFVKANIAWDAERITAFFAAFETHMEEERQLFADKG